MAHLTCKRCGVNDRNVGGTGRVEAYCKPCMTEYQKERLATKREFLNQYKVERGCCVCGYNAHPVALELNHIDPNTKSFGISSKLISLTTEKLMNELEKCNVMCANCHQIHTHENKHHLPKALREGND